MKILLLASLLSSTAVFAQSTGWRDMASAPHDGTPIEIRNTYGVAPWFGLFRWTAVGHREDSDCTFSQKDGRPFVNCYPNGHVTEYTKSEPSWEEVSRPGHFQLCDRSETCHWRPYAGNVSAYTDPTGGAQFTSDYWRR